MATRKIYITILDYALDESYIVCFILMILITVIIPVRVENYKPDHASLMPQTRCAVHVAHNLRPG